MVTTAQELYTKILPHAMAAYAGKSSDMESAKQMAHALASECAGECARLGLLEGISAEQRPYGSLPAVNASGNANVAPSSGAQGLARFVEPDPQGGTVSGVSPVGSPYQPAQHYNVAGNSDQTASQPSALAAQPATPWYPPHLRYLHEPQAASAQVQSRAPQAQIASGAGMVARQQEPFDVGGMKVVPPTGNTFVPPAQAGVMNNVVQVPTPQGHSALGTDGVIVQPSQRPNTQDQIIAPGNQAVITQAGGAGTTFVAERIGR
jgi:hypothetical protein